MLNPPSKSSMPPSLNKFFIVFAKPHNPVSPDNLFNVPSAASDTFTTLSPSSSNSGPNTAIYGAALAAVPTLNPKTWVPSNKSVPILLIKFVKLYIK